MAWSAGQALTAALMNTYVPQEFTAWTPVLTATTTNPAINNGTSTGRYRQEGKQVFFTAKIVFGSTSTFGSGSWFLSLPVARASGGVVRASGLYIDTSAGTYYIGVNYAGTTTTIGLAYSASPILAVTPTAPMTWATTDEVEVSGTYEVP